MTLTRPERTAGESGSARDRIAAKREAVTAAGAWSGA